MDKTAGVYKIENTINGALYIGSSSNVSIRWYQHLYHLKRGDHHNQHLQRAFRKYGEQAFQFHILEQTTDLVVREQHYLDAFSPSYNILPKAGTTKGRVCSEQARAKYRSMRLGKRVSDETKEKLRQLNKGRAPSSRCFAALSLTLTGVPRSDAVRAKIRQSQKTRKAVERVATDGTVKSYLSIQLAAKDGFVRSCIRHCCEGRQGTHAGYEWRYAETSELAST